LREERAVQRNPSPFDEELLSGFLDGALSQLDAQRVRLRLEEDAEARQVFAELRLLRQAARSTRLPPPEIEWPELPRHMPTRIGRAAGFAILIVWVLLVSGLGIRFFLAEGTTPLRALLYLGLPAGVLLLLLSVVADRLRALRHDRYRGVQR
jgi:hypothetical protein